MRFAFNLLAQTLASEEVVAGARSYAAANTAGNLQCVGPSQSEDWGGPTNTTTKSINPPLSTFTSSIGFTRRRRPFLSWVLGAFEGDHHGAPIRRSSSHALQSFLHAGITCASEY